MENQLVTIEQSNQILALSSDDGIKGIIEEAKEAIHNLDGGSMKTATGRKKIRSNAFKATKLKTSLAERADELIVSIENKIAPELLIIKSIKDNKKVLGAGLDGLRKEVNAEVDKFEAELKAIEDEKAAAIESARLAKEKDELWDFALMELKVFNIELEAKKARLAEEERVEQARLVQAKIDSDALIAKQAAEAATIEAERMAQKAIDDAQELKQKAINDKIQADKDLLASQAREKLLNEQAEQTRLNNEWLAYISEAYQYNDKLNAEREQKRQQAIAEKARLESIENERLAGIERARLAQKAIDDAAAVRLADTNYKSSVKKSILDVLLANGIPEEYARTMINLAANRKLPKLTINY